MSDSKVAPQQFKQPSRKGKKAWRKNVDITEVQKGLETLREEVIQGGPVAEKPSEELFVLDTIGSEAIKKSYHKTHKPLKVDEIIARRSAVPGVDSRKRPSSRITDGIIEPTGKRHKKNWISKREVQRVKESIRDGAQLSRDRIEEDQPSAFDLWSDNTVARPELTELRYVEKPRPKVAPQTLRRAPIPLTANGKPVRAIRQPNPGTSYNPVDTDWVSLLAHEGEKEIEAEKKRRQQAEAEAERAARVAAAAAEEVADRTEDESAWEGFESGRESPESLKKKRPERKTLPQRNKIKRRKISEREAKHEKKMVDRRTHDSTVEGANMQAIRHENSEVLVHGESEDSSESGDDAMLRRRRMGNIAVPEKQLEVVLRDELQDSLRRLKPEGNLLNDRFRNLLVNGKLEVRKPIIQPKKARRTFTEKWTYKDFSVPV